LDVAASERNANRTTSTSKIFRTISRAFPCVTCEQLA
jgi:hypothetical protein